MAPPKLVYAAPNGQSSVRVLFDQRMRELGASHIEDPQNPSLWTVGGGLPAVVSITCHSPSEYELHLASPAPLGGGYTVTINLTAQSMAGERMDPGSLSQTFAVTVTDFTIADIVWLTPSAVDVVFSSALDTITYGPFSDLLTFEPVDLLARQVPVIGFEQSGATARFTFEAAGTAGARYALNLIRDQFRSATGVVLRAGMEDQVVYGQGQPPVLSAIALTEISASITASDVPVLGLEKTGWPLAPGLYKTDRGSLGTAIEAGATPAIMKFTGAAFDLGSTVSFSVAKTTRLVTSGVSFVNQAAIFTGAGTEAVGVGTTTLSKTSGAPFEIVYSGGLDSLTRAGRQLTVTMTVTFPPSVTSYPLLAITLLNTQLSVVITKTTDNLATLSIYRGSTVVRSSGKFNPTASFTLKVIDASADDLGFVAVFLDGEVVLGCLGSEVTDPLLLDPVAGNTMFALTLGSPIAPTATFSILFTTAIQVDAFLGVGLRGQESRDLLSVAGASISAVVAVSPTPVLSPGYANTGKPAFGVHAECIESVDAVQVIIGLNQDAAPLQFTGSVTLMTGGQQVMDQTLFDETYIVTDKQNGGHGGEIVIVFLHPIAWSGLLVGVAVDIAGVTYSVVVPIVPIGMPALTGELTQQPANWAHPRMPRNANASFGPAVSFGPA